MNDPHTNSCVRWLFMTRSFYCEIGEVVKYILNDPHTNSCVRWLFMTRSFYCEIGEVVKYILFERSSY